MKAPSSIKLQLLLGEGVPSPAPLNIVEKLESVEIQQSAESPSGFQLNFHADRTKGSSSDYALLSSPLLKPWNRVIVMVTLNNQPTVLVDGFITHQELAHNKQFSASSLTISGEDVSLLMDRVQYSMEYPEMGDSIIAEAVLVKYALIGILPEVIPTAADLIPSVVERVPQQNSTDREYLQMLAAPYGYRFYVRPGKVPGENIAYWGPPKNEGVIKPALSIDQDSATNVDQINFTLDSTAPVQVYGMVQDVPSEEDMPLVTVESSLLPPLASDPALKPAGLLQRRNLFTDPRYGYAQAYVDGQAMTNQSTEKVALANGQLDTLRYGAILEAGDIAEIRGAGMSYDGQYRIQTVTHTMARGQYKQAFVLERGGTGSTIERVA